MPQEPAKQPNDPCILCGLLLRHGGVPFRDGGVHNRCFERNRLLTMGEPDTDDPAVLRLTWRQYKGRTLPDARRV